MLKGQRVLAAGIVTLLALTATSRGDDYVVDTNHSGIGFKISHLGLAWVQGRFNEFSGDFTVDEDPAKCSFRMNIKVDSVDTNNAKRDGHLKAADFFNVKQFPTMSFKSSAVKAIKDGYQVTGDFAMHGMSKPITFALVGGRKAEFPKGVQRTGFTTELTLKRSEFGMDRFTDTLGDDVHIVISFEGTKK